MDVKNSENAKLKCERQFHKFLKERIGRMGGTIEIQHITGHLSQLTPEVRSTIGTSKTDIISFLNKHPETFFIENNTVSLVKSMYIGYDSDNCSENVEASLPAKILDGKGVVVKLTPTFGFIKSQRPVKTSIFFRAIHFGFAEDTNLTDCGINIGTMVNFDAFKENKVSSSSKYHAIKVRKNEKNDEENNVAPNPRKNRESGIYDPINFDGEGVIQNVFPTHGFIFADANSKNTVFFYKNRVVKYDNIVDLTKVFQSGDLVEFSAHRTTKQNTKARWEAIKVWKKSKNNSTVTKHKDAPIKSNSSVISSITSKSSSSVISSNQSATLPGFYSKSIPSRVHVKLKDPAREMIHDQTGKICPRSSGTVIKFGENFKDLADGDSSYYYICGTRVTEISWEFCEGDNVKFDAVKIKSSPGWKALLVWVGDKPDVVLSPHLGNFSEFTDDEVGETPDEVDEIPNEEVHEIPDEVQKNSNQELNKIDEDLDEIPDDTESSASGYQMSLSSHSSLKSTSILSDTSDFKTTKLPKESFRTAGSSDNTEDRNTSNKGFKVRNLCNSPVNSSSSSSKESKTSSCSKNSETSHQSKGSKKSQESKNSNVTKSNRNELDFVREKSAASFRDLPKSVEDSKTVSPSNCDYVTNIQDAKPKVRSKKYNFVNQKNIPHSVWHEFSECPQISDYLEIKDNFDTVALSAESEQTEIKKAPSITKHKNIVGRITKVYAVFAEAKSLELQNIVSFSWNVFYCNRNSMDDLDINDLRKVLKVGETVAFNYFEIVDDDRQIWQKVSLAWSGPKPPRLVEITPDEFIQQNNLSVTVDNVLNTVQPEKTVKRFLIGHDEISHKNTDEVGVSQTESCCSEDGGTTFHSPASFVLSEVLEESTSRLKSLSSMISQKLMMSRDILMDSKVDLNGLSAEIVSLVLEQYNIKECNPTSEKLEKEISNVTCSCGKNASISSSSQIVNTRNIEVQTICTGEIMAQNIFTEY